MCHGNAASFFIPSLNASFHSLEYPLKHSVLLDTGTTLHIFNNPDRFSGLQSAPYGDFLWAGEKKATIQGYGTVDVFLNDPGTKGSRIMRLNDVAFCPIFAANLVSFHLLEKRGLYWDTRPQHQCLRITANHNVLALIERHFDQYVLEYNPLNALEGSSPATFALRTRRRSHQPRPHQKALGERWHLRLGHPGPQALEHLVNHSSGVRIKGPTTVQCDNCGLAKMKRQIQRVPRHPDPELPPGDILAVDLHPFEADKKGFSHLLLVTDRVTGFIWDFHLERVNSSLIRRTLNYLLGVLER